MQTLPSHVTAGRLHLFASSASSPAPGPDRRVQSQDELSVSKACGGAWPAMALLDVLFCCLLAVWHCQPGLGLPLAPAGGQSPAPAVGESDATLSLLGPARERWGGSVGSKSGKARGQQSALVRTPANWTPDAQGASSRHWARGAGGRGRRRDQGARSTLGQVGARLQRGVPSRRGSWIPPPIQWLNTLSPGVCSGGGKEKLHASRNKAGSGMSRTTSGLEAAQSGRGAANFPAHLRSVNFIGTQSICCPAHRVWWLFLATLPGRVQPQSRCYPPLELMRPSFHFTWMLDSQQTRPVPAPSHSLTPPPLHNT